MLALILRGGLARPEVNVPLILDGRRVIPDFRWPPGGWSSRPTARPGTTTAWRARTMRSARRCSSATASACCA